MAKKSLLRRNMDLIIAFLVIYLGLMAFLYLFQRDFQYFPGDLRESPALLGVEEPEIISIQPTENLNITGWYWPAKDLKSPTIVYFHGNAQAYQYWMNKTAVFRQAGYGVLFAEYRGYGGNDGSPTEDGLYQDARGYLSWLIKDKGINPKNIIFYGESLGTGVAVQMATEFDVRAIILESAYSATSDIAKKRYWMFPVDYLMKDQYRSIDKIGNINAPILFMHAVHDDLISIDLARDLYAATSQPKTFIEIPQGGHNDLFENGALKYAVEFIEKLYSVRPKDQP